MRHYFLVHPNTIFSRKIPCHWSECGNFRSETQTKVPLKQMEITLCVSFRTVDFMHEKFKSYLLVEQMCPCFKTELTFRSDLEHIA